MGIREKILIALMAGVIGYGLYDFVMTRIRQGSLNSRVEEIKKETEALVTTTRAQLSTSALSQREQDLLAHMSTPWTNQLFTAMLHAPAVEVVPEVEAPTDPESGTPFPEETQPMYRYTGFLIAGGEKIAFINGRGYKVDDEVGTSGYHVKSIEPEECVLQRENGNQILTLALYQPATIKMNEK